MRSLPRALWLSLWFAASGCLGGPTSDWPKGADSEGDDDEPQTPAKDAGSAGRDAGRRSDAGAAAPNGVCSPNPAGDGGVPSVDPSDGGVPTDAGAAWDAQVRSAVDALAAADATTGDATADDAAANDDAANVEPTSDAGVGGCQPDGT